MSEDMTDATKWAARIWDIRERMEKEWDGADEGVREDLEALRIAADALKGPRDIRITLVSPDGSETTATRRDP